MGGIDSYTKLMLHMNSDFSDSSDSGHTPTVNGATIDTSIKKFGAGSGKFVSASSQYVSYPSHSDFDFRTYTNSWTVDFWTYDTNIADNHTYLSIGISDYEALVIAMLSSAPAVVWSENGSTNITLQGGSISNSTQTHVAVVNNAGTVTLYIGGVSVGSLAMGANMHLGGGYMVKLGAHYNLNSTWFFNGNEDELRISKGIARWTANFTPPTSEYTGDIVTPDMWQPRIQQPYKERIEVINYK